MSARLYCAPKKYGVDSYESCRVMVAVILVVAGVLVAGGFYAVMTGAEIIVLERGWSMVIAGSVFAAAGFVLAAIALLMRDLRRLAAGLEFIPAREAPLTTAGQPFDEDADFRPVVVPGVPIGPSAAAGAAAAGAAASALGEQARAEEEPREEERTEEPGFEAMRPFPSRRFEDVSAVEEEREEPAPAEARDESAPEEEPLPPTDAGKPDDPFARFDFSRDFFAPQRRTAKAESQEADDLQKEETRLSTFGTAPQVSEEPEAAAEPETEASPPVREETLPQLPSWLRRSEDRGEPRGFGEPGGSKGERTQEHGGFETPAAPWPQPEREAPPSPPAVPAGEEGLPEPEEAVQEDVQGEDRTEQAPAEAAEPEEQAAPEEAGAAPAAPTVVGTYSAGGNLYVMYSDGSIEAETGRGVFKFASLDELKNYIATGEGGQLQSPGQPAPKKD